ncbi:MAG: hypothetical protein WA030_03130 [Candidatus Microsaccharimonas sp.]
MKYMLIQFAQKLTPGGNPDTQVNIPIVTGDDLLTNGLNMVYFLAGLIAVIVIIAGGITYATSRGEAAKLTKAKNLILYAIVGLGVILVAFTITNFVIGAF